MIVFPLLVALKVIPPVYVIVIPLTSERLPYMFKAADHAHVGAPTNGFPHVISAQNASLSMVMVYAVVLERVSNTTLSLCVGVFPTHGAPPEEVAQ